MRSGNIVADYQIDIITCPECDGQKIISVDKVILADLINRYFLTYTLSELKKILKNNEMVCPVCEGKGYKEYWL